MIPNNKNPIWKENTKFKINHSKKVLNNLNLIA